MFVLLLMVVVMLVGVMLQVLDLVDHIYMVGVELLPNLLVLSLLCSVCSVYHVGFLIFDFILLRPAHMFCLLVGQWWLWSCCCWCWGVIHLVCGEFFHN